MLAVPPVVLLDLGWPALGGYDVGYVWLAVRSASLPPAVLTAGWVAVGWAAWGAFAVLTLADVVALARGHAPRLTPLRLLALTSISTVLASPSSAGAVSAPAPAEQAAAPAPQDPAPDDELPEAGAADAQAQHRTRVLSGFALGSAQLDTRMRANLAPLTDLVGAYLAPHSRITVTGHTDASGPADYNRKLSRQRAEAVAEVLGRHAPAGVEITVAARGEDDPRYEQDTLAPPAAQRRVEITYTLAPPTPSKPDDTARPSTPDAAPTSAPEAEDGTAATDWPAAAVIGGVAATSAALGAGAGRLTRRRTPAPAPNARERGAPARQGEPPPPRAHTAPHNPPTPQRAGDTEGVLDAQHRLRLATTATADPVRLPTRGGLCLQGRCAEHMAAALALDCLQEEHPVALTEELAQRLGLDRSTAPNLHCSTGAADLLLHAEAHLLGRARRAAEEAAPVAEPDPGVLVVLADAPTDPGARTRLRALAAEAGIVLLVLGEADLERTVVCDRDDVLQVTVDAETYRLDDLHVPTLTPQEAAQRLAEHTPAPEPADSGDPSRGGDATAGAETTPAPTDAAGRAEEERPDPAPAEEHTAADAADRSQPGENGHPADQPPGPSPTPPSSTTTQTAEHPGQQHAPPHPAEPDTRAPAETVGADASASPRVRLRVFAPHPVVLTPDGEEIATGLRSSARLLLGLLALRRADGAGTEEITELLETDPVAAKAQRTAAVSNARSIIRTALNRPQAEVITHRAGRYRLDEHTLACDVWDFDDALAAARTAQDHDRLGNLHAALALYRAPLLGEVDHPLIEPERENRRRLASSACVEAAHLSEDTPAALEWLERARGLDEHNEAIYQELMRAHARNDRPDEVTRVYGLLQQALDAIGATPSPASTRLVEELTSLAPRGEKKPVRHRPRRR
nr:OmpA family protein [Streptomonospora sp. PA3]